MGNHDILLWLLVGNHDILLRLLVPGKLVLRLLVPDKLVMTTYSSILSEHSYLEEKGCRIPQFWDPEYCSSGYKSEGPGPRHCQFQPV